MCVRDGMCTSEQPLLCLLVNGADVKGSRSCEESISGNMEAKWMNVGRTFPPTYATCGMDHKMLNTDIVF